MPNDALRRHRIGRRTGEPFQGVQAACPRQEYLRLRQHSQHVNLIEVHNVGPVVGMIEHHRLKFRVQTHSPMRIWKIGSSTVKPGPAASEEHPCPRSSQFRDGYTAVTPYLIVEDAAGFLDFLTNAFGAVERLRIPMGQGLIGHAEVEIRGAAVMLSDAAPPDFPVSSSQIHLYVEDVDVVYAQAVKAGATAVGGAGRPVLRRPHRPGGRIPRATSGQLPATLRTWTWTI